VTAVSQPVVKLSSCILLDGLIASATKVALDVKLKANT
jgi:hypothetical protein